MALRGTTAKIDMAELEKLSSLQCTDEEIAAWFGVTTRTIERRRKKAKFAEVMDRGKAKGRISVHRMQMKLLEAGNATMGVWLGKNILNQVDEVRHELHGTIGTYLAVVLPRPIEPGASGTPRIARQLIEAAEADDVEIIEPADHEKMADDE